MALRLHAADKRFTLILILCAIALLLIVTYFLAFDTVTFEIQDKCGRFLNLFSHTIEDEGDCKVRCMQQCRSQDLSYQNIDFTARTDGCNGCFCSCREFVW